MTTRNWSTISASGCVDEQKHSSLFLQHNKVFKMISNYKNILTLKFGSRTACNTRPSDELTFDLHLSFYTKKLVPLHSTHWTLNTIYLDLMSFLLSMTNKHTVSKY